MPSWKKVITSGSNAVLNHITASGDVTIDSKLGIGTTSPDEGLHLKSKNILFERAGYDTGDQIKWKVGGNDRFTLRFDTTAGGLLFFNEHGGVGNHLFLDRLEAHVGIGTTTPTSELTVQGDISASGDFLGSSTSTGSFGAGYIDNKLGIGTTSPEEEIHIVAGNASIKWEESGGTAGRLIAQGVGSGASLYTTTSSPVNIATNVGGPSADYTIRANTDKTVVFQNSTTGYDRITFSAASSSISSSQGFIYFEDGQNISGSSTSTGSFGRVEAAGVISADNIGRANTNIQGRAGLFGMSDANDNPPTFNSSYQGIFEKYGGTGQVIVKRTGRATLLLQGHNDYVSVGSTNNYPLRFITNNTEAARFDTSQNFLPVGNISGSSTSTGSFGSLVVADAIQGNTTLKGGNLIFDAYKGPKTNSEYLYITSTRGVQFVDYGAGTTFHVDGTHQKIYNGSPSIGMTTYFYGDLRLDQGNYDITGSATSTASFGRIQATTIGGNSPLTIESPTLSGNTDIDGNLTVTGDITAQNFIVSSSVTSITYQSLSGSTIFGDSTDDTHQFTGSLSVRPPANGGLDIFSDSDGGSAKLNIKGRAGYRSQFTLDAPNNGHGDIFFKRDGANRFNINYGYTSNELSLTATGGGATTSAIIVDVNGNLTFGGTSISGSSTSTGSFGQGHVANLLGVGTLSPSSTLHVVGDIRTQSDNNRISFFLANGTTRLNEFKNMGDNSTILKTSGAYNLRFGTNDVDRLMIQQGTGNIGIGTTSPGAKLEVIGDISGSLTSTGSFGHVKIPNGNIDIMTGNANTRVGIGKLHTNMFYVGANPSGSAGSGGNVGVKVGTVDSGGNVRKHWTFTSDGHFKSEAQNLGSITMGGTTFKIDSTYNDVKIQMGYDTVPFVLNKPIYNLADVEFIQDEKKNIKFFEDAQTGGEIMQLYRGGINISGSGNVSGSSSSTGSFGHGYIDNKLGINTTTPQSALEVFKTDNFAPISFHDGYYGYSFGGGYMPSDVNPNSNGMSLYMSSTQIYLDGLHGNTRFVFRAGGTEKFQITGNNVLFPLANQVISGSSTSTGSFGKVATDTITPLTSNGTITLQSTESPLRINRLGASSYLFGPTSVVSGENTLSIYPETNSSGINLRGKNSSGTLQTGLLVDADGNTRFYGTKVSGSSSSTGSFGKGYFDNGIDINSNLQALGVGDAMALRAGNGHISIENGYDLYLRRNGGAVNFNSIGLPSGATYGYIKMPSNTQMDFYAGNGVKLSLTQDNKISGSSTSTGSFGSLKLADAYQGTLAVKSGIHLVGDNVTMNFYAANHTTRLMEFKNMGDNSTILKTSGAYNLRFGTNDLDRLMIQQGTGNVGIGTTSPANKLQVAGTISGSGDLKVGGSITVGPGGYIKGYETGNFVYGRNYMKFSNSFDHFLAGDLQFYNWYNYSNTSTPQMSLKTGRASGGELAILTVSGSIITTGANEVISGSASSTGSFGQLQIGQQGYNAKINAVNTGGDYTTDLLYLRGGNGDRVLRVAPSGGGLRLGHVGNSTWSIDTDGYENVRFSKTSDLKFFTNNGERVTINSSGNVGIGTTSPNVPLEVRKAGHTVLIASSSTAGGGTLAVQSSNGTGAGVVFRSDGGHNRGRIYYDGHITLDNADDAARSVRLRTGQGTAASGKDVATIKITPSGSNSGYFNSHGGVSLGRNHGRADSSTSTDFILHISASADHGLMTLQDSNVNIVGNISGSVSSTGSFGALKIKNGPLVTANSNGIGIGNVGSDIDHELDVEGNIRIRNAIHSFATDNRGFTREWLAFNEGAPTYKTSVDYKFHNFQNFSGTTIMAIGGSNNRVGIGTESPSYALDVVLAGDEQFRVGRSAQKYVAIRDDVMQFTGMTGNGMRIQTSDNSDIKFSAGTGDIIFDYGNSGGRVISYADVTVSASLTVTGDIIAENYIVSSSTTYMTTSFSAGSTAFGDTQDDNHDFTGSLNVTGSISIEPNNSDVTAATEASLYLRGPNQGIKMQRYNSGNTGAYAHLYLNGNDYLVVKTNGNNSQGIATDRIGSLTQTTTNNYIHFDGFDKDFYGYHEGASTPYETHDTNGISIMLNEDHTFKVSGSLIEFTPTEKVSVTGNLELDGALTEASTMRIKTNIETLESPLDKISKLRGVSYNLKKNNEPSIGMIAEEVEEVFPELVSKDDSGKAAAMSYGRMTAVLLEAIKELKEEVDELKQENIYMKQMNRKNK